MPDPTAPAERDGAGSRRAALPAAARGQFDEGPWEQAFWFVVREPVRSKSNHRHSAAAKAQWAELAGYADRIFLAARAARPRGWDAGSPGAEIAARPRIVAFVYARSMLDVGNLDKSILDAVEGARAKKGLLAPGSGAVVMVSDAQVAFAAKMGERTNRDPGALIAFARLPADAAPALVAAAGSELAARASALLEVDRA